MPTLSGVDVTDRVEVSLTVNGRPTTRVVSAHLSLLQLLHDEAGVADPKYGCGEGVCGACTVLLDGEPVSSCIVLAAQAHGGEVLTASGLTSSDGTPSPLQEAFHLYHAAQCGFCTPGMLMCATAILAGSEPLSRAKIREGLHGNLCRCTGYGPIVDAIEDAQGAR
jgi:carbon-monoxide dehydrogenase small subunit